MPHLTPVGRLLQPVVRGAQGWLCVRALEMVLGVTVL